MMQPSYETVLTTAEREQLTWYKMRYMAMAYGFDATVAKRLAFVRAMVMAGRLGADDQAPSAA